MNLESVYTYEGTHDIQRWWLARTSLASTPLADS